MLAKNNPNLNINAYELATLALNNEPCPNCGGKLKTSSGCGGRGCCGYNSWTICLNEEECGLDLEY